MTIFLIIFISLVLIIGLIRFQRSGGISFPWIRFYVKGKETGFKNSEIRLLRRAAVQVRFPEPTNMFWSDNALNRCIREVILLQRSRNQENNPEAIDFISQLFGFRKRIEMNLPKHSRGITSSRDIDTGQGLKIALPGEGIYTSRVVENLRKYVAISYPEGQPDGPGLGWQGQEIRVNFWRVEDAAYVFETEVLGDHRNQSIIHIKHTTKLIRSQKRTSIRVGINQQAQLFQLNSSFDGDERASKPFRCKLINISEAGAGIMIGGRAKAGRMVRVETELAGQDIVLTGVVKNVTYKEMKNFSILNIEARSVDPAMKNRILMYVYGIFMEER